MCPNILILLVGNKSDIDFDERAVRASDIENVMDDLNVTYFECSAKDGDGVEELFRRRRSESLTLLSHGQHKSRSTGTFGLYSWCRTKFMKTIRLLFSSPRSTIKT